MDPVLRALVEPRRREIMQLVQAGEMSSGEIAAHFSITRPAISQHLGILEAAGLVSVRRVGTKRLYRAQPKALAELREYLEGFWDQHLKELAAAAEAEEHQLAIAAETEERPLATAAEVEERRKIHDIWPR